MLLLNSLHPDEFLIEEIYYTFISVTVAGIILLPGNFAGNATLKIK
jgi:hypothetical protein